MGGIGIESDIWVELGPEGAPDPDPRALSHDPRQGSDIRKKCKMHP